MDIDSDNVNETQSMAETQPTETNTTPESSSPSGERFGLVRHPDGRTELKRIVEEEEPTAEPSVDPPTPQQAEEVPPAETVTTPPVTPQPTFGVDAGNEPRAQPYSIADISTAIQAGIPLATERIPSELVGWYQQKQAEQMQKDAPDMKEQQRAFFRNIAQKAKEEALAELKMTDADLTKDLDELDFDEQEKLIQKRQQFQELAQVNQSVLLNQVQFAMAQQAQEKERQMSVVRGIVEYADELRKSEPNFEAINLLMRDHYKTMPYQDAAVIKNAIDALSTGQIDQRQADTLRIYYEKTRLAYYANKNNLTTKPQTITTPPVTEKPTSGNVQSEQTDWGSMRNMTPLERKNYFIKNFKI